MAKSGLFSPACKFDDTSIRQAARCEHIQLTLSGYHFSPTPRCGRGEGQCRSCLASAIYQTCHDCRRCLIAVSRLRSQPLRIQSNKRRIAPMGRGAPHPETPSSPLQPASQLVETLDDKLEGESKPNTVLPAPSRRCGRSADADAVRAWAEGCLL